MKLFSNCSFSLTLKQGAILLLLISFQQIRAFDIQNTVSQTMEVLREDTEQYRVVGNIVDKTTGKVIPFCNISLGNSHIGTASNVLGKFSIMVDTLPSRLVFFHTDYKTLYMEISKTTEIEVKMVSLISLPKDGSVRRFYNESNTLQLTRKALQKAQEGMDHSYGKAFYRQRSSNGEEQVEFMEAIYDVDYSRSGIEDWEILYGRYAHKDSNSVTNKNYAQLSRLMKAVQPQTNLFVLPLHPSFEKYYKLRVTEVLKSERGNIAVVGFRPRKDTNVPVFAGKVYIDIETYDILKVTGNISKDDLALVNLVSKEATWDNYTLSYEIAFRPDKDGELLLNHINVNQEFDYHRQGYPNSHVSSFSNLTFIEHYVAQKKQMKSKDDIDLSFWERNSFVKPTSLEEVLIAEFEQDNAFASVYSNNGEQHSLVQQEVSNDPFISELSRKMKNRRIKNPIEKVYLHTDMELLSPGDDIWYSAYTVLGPSHLPSQASKVLHVDLIGPDNKIIVAQTHEIIDGRSQGTIKIPWNLAPGCYQLRAFTQWMRNFGHDFFYTKELTVLDETPSTDSYGAERHRLDFQFFPEGGNAVVGVSNKIAYKAIGPDGLGKNVKGQVMDSKYNIVAYLNTLSRGAGLFYLTPKKGETYAVLLADGSIYDLPKTLSKGYVMAVDNNTDKKNVIKVKIRASESLQSRPFYIVGHVRNKKYYQGKFWFDGRSMVDFEIPRTILPSGVMTLTLFDGDKKPWCERLVSTGNVEQLVIETKLSSSHFGKREKMSLDVQVTDLQGSPVQTSLSVAVTDADQFLKSSGSRNIVSYLLLESDLKGHIENPWELFKNQEGKGQLELDLILMTHGWRRFQWQDVLQETSFDEKEFPFAKGLHISGTVRNTYGRPLPNINLNMFAKSKNGITGFTGKTDVSGNFLLGELNMRDSIQLVINAYEGKRGIGVDIELHPPSIDALPLPRFVPLAKANPDWNSVYLENYLIRSVGNKRVTVLETATVNAKKRTKLKTSEPQHLGIIPSAVVYTKDNPNDGNMGLLLSRLPGVVSAGGNVLIPRFMSTTDPTPLFLLDGQQVSLGDILGVSIINVERVDVVKNISGLSLYGMHGGNGVIRVYTKVGRTEIDKITRDFKVQGHAVSREFYSPKYDVSLPDHEEKDYRATLYWNPLVETDKNGKVTLTFFNSDVAKSLQVSVESLTTDGLPGIHLQTFGENAKDDSPF